ncbi:uncharacterized protein LOC143212256 [Lasioglossum baleicum]|uniref:uncharacterized protein LOC143212256 n=1 Tax=Lasioglossum baleicum TaxID=434251 RepID=UPI003FCE6A4E
MDHEKYYDIRGDSYVIHFPNFNGLSTDEVERMFSVYGPMSVDTKGQYSLCFIRYKNLEDTINCLNGFKNHKSIKILQHKNKTSNSTKKNCTNKKQKTNVPSLFDTKETDREESSNKFQNGKQCHFNDPVDGRDSDHNSSTASISSFAQLLKMKKIIKKRTSSVASSEISDSYSTKMVNSHNEDEIPSLTYNNKKTTVEAQEVIIANIHPDLGVQDILTLFKDYHPICMTFIKQVPDTEIRYCHAYFMSARDALAIEKKFDKYLLREHVLIVLRPQMLIEEAFFM